MKELDARIDAQIAEMKRLIASTKENIARDGAELGRWQRMAERLATELEALQAEREHLLEVLRLCRRIIQQGGDGAIQDTIWVQDGMTLVDAIDCALGDRQ